MSQQSRILLALDRIRLIALYISGCCLVAMTLVIAYLVFGRYVLNSTPSWAEALSILLMSWFIFLGAAVGVRENTHLGFDVLLYIMPSAGKKLLRTLADLAVLAFGIGMVFFGWQLVVGTWTAIKPTLGIPDGAGYIPLVVGGVLVSVFSTTRIIERLLGGDPDTLPNEQAQKGSN